MVAALAEDRAVKEAMERMHAEQDMDSTYADPEVLAAAGEIIRLDNNGKCLNIDELDLPYEVLVKVAATLNAFGVSNAVKDTLLSAIEDYALNLGAVFTNKMRP